MLTSSYSRENTKMADKMGHCTIFWDPVRRESVIEVSVLWRYMCIEIMTC